MRTLAERAREVKASRERYRSLFEGVPIGLYESTPAGQILDANPACIQILGLSDRESLLSADATELYVDHGQRVLWQEALERQGSVDRFEARLARPNGEIIWVRESAQLVRDEAGRTVSYRGSIEDITESKLAQIRLNTLAAVIDQSSETVVLTDLNGEIVYANPAFERASGYPIVEAVGQNPRILQSGLQDQAFYENLWNTIASGRLWAGVFVNKRKDGSFYREEAIVFPIQDDRGQAINYAAVKRDVTERALAAERLEQRNLELAALNALAQALSSSLELDDMLDEALSRIVHTLGFSGGIIGLVESRSGELVLASYAGLPLELVEWLQREGLDGSLCDVVRGSGEPLRLENLGEGAPVDVSALLNLGIRSYVGTPIVYQDRAVGTLSLFDTGPHPVSDAEQMLLIAIGQQIGVAAENARLYRETQRRVRELELLHDVSLAAALGEHLDETQQAATDALAAAIPLSRVALMLVDEQRRTLGIQASSGYPEESMEGLCVPLGKGIVGWVAQHGQPALVGDVRQDPRYLEVAADVRSELCVPLTVGPRVIGVLNLESPGVHAFTDDDQRLLGVLANNLAVLIERVRLFEQVEAARLELRLRADALVEANARLQQLGRVKDEFLASMSHELRTPLNAILGFAQLMRRSSSLPEEHRESVEIISSSGEHLLDLINDVLDMAKIESGRITFDSGRFDLDRLLDGIQAMVSARAENKGILLAFERASDVPQFVSTDERKLRQVLLNLLGNAVKFTKEGAVTLRVRCHPSKETSFHAPGRTLHFEVQDTGAGIAAEEMAGLFEAFTQTASGKRSQEGTGLGLPISRRFVQTMGGELTVRSQVGQGSTFSFDLPVALAEADDAAPEQVVRQVSSLAPGEPECRILIVDDRAENRLLVRRLLGAAGFEVQEAADGREAVAIHQDWQPHLILMDMRMPVMDGVQATRQIRDSEQGQHTIIVALTASVLEEERDVILAAGCDDYVRKPFREGDLFGCLARHLDVRYTYADVEEPATGRAGSSGGHDSLTPEALAGLPEEWIAALRDAASRARSDLIADLLGRIDQEHPEVAGALAQLVDEFRFAEILSLTAN